MWVPKYRGDVCIVCGRHDRELTLVEEGIYVCRGEHLPQDIRTAILQEKQK